MRCTLIPRDFSRCSTRERMAGCSTLVVTISSRPSSCVERREDCRVVGFRAARGKDDLVVERGAEQRLQLLARQLQRLAYLRAEGVRRRCDCRTGRKNTAASPPRQPGRCVWSRCYRDKSAARNSSFNAVSMLRLRSAGDRDETHELTQLLDDAGLDAVERGMLRLAEDAGAGELDHHLVAVDPR